MHPFDVLVQGCTEFTLNALDGARAKIEDGLQASGATSLVRASQAVQLQKAITAVGMFSMFDAQLQSALGVANGFRGAEEILKAEGKMDLRQRFVDLQLAINVLKHGEGRSYEDLVQRALDLPFRIKLRDEDTFFEGDVSEVNTLVQVDDAFVRACAAVVAEVAEVVRRVSGDVA